MNSLKFKKIEDLLDNKSKQRLRASYFEKTHTEIYNQIIDYCILILDLPFNQKVWHWVNDNPNYVKCKCGNDITFHRNWLDGYRNGCSAKCAQSDEDTKLKRKSTTLEKYGVDNISKLEESKQKQEHTNLERYGSKSSAQNKEVQDKIKLTTLERYGVESYFQTDEFKKQTKVYYLNKWGVDHQSKVYDIQEKIKATNFKKYGVTTYLNTEHSRSCIKVYNKSSYEFEICEWLSLNTVDYIHSCYDVISPLSIDIYIPNKLAIEFNGLYWHSDRFKSKDYHLNKTNLCKEKGLSLMHIWEDDWRYRKDIIKSIILNKLGLIKNKIYARKCNILEVPNDVSSLFLNTNHIQGYCRYSKSYGLYYNDELISLMTFGYRGTNAKKEYELIRFCNKINTVVVGAASKLFNEFIRKNIDINEVTSYSDSSIFEGGIYSKLGFENIKKTSPNYWWVVEGIRKHRFNYNKQKLIKMGADPSKTEVEIMNSAGYFRIWGCGQEKWIWKRL